MQNPRWFDVLNTAPRGRASHVSLCISVHRQNMSDHGAFAEWFHKTIKSVEYCEKEELCFVDVIKEWCKDNNHEWTRQGVFNNDIGVAESSVDDEDLDCCVFCTQKE